MEKLSYLECTISTDKISPYRPLSDLPGRISSLKMNIRGSIMVLEAISWLEMNVRGIILVLEDKMKYCLKGKNNEQSRRFLLIVWYKYL